MFPDAVRRLKKIPDSFGEKHARIARRAVTESFSLGEELFGNVLGMRTQLRTEMNVRRSLSLSPDCFKRLSLPCWKVGYSIGYLILETVLTRPVIQVYRGGF